MSEDVRAFLKVMMWFVLVVLVGAIVLACFIAFMFAGYLFVNG